MCSTWSHGLRLKVQGTQGCAYPYVLGADQSCRQGVCNKDIAYSVYCSHVGRPGLQQGKLPLFIVMRIVLLTVWNDRRALCE